jgi:general secretion pathway protein D
LELEKVKEVEKMAKKIMAMVLLVALSCFSAFAEDGTADIKLSLEDYASMVADMRKINIVVAGELQGSNINFLIGNSIKDSKNYLEVFKTMLNKKDLKLINKGGYYYIDKKHIEGLKTSIRVVKPSNLIEKEFVNLCTLLDLNCTYFKNSNTFMFSATDQKFKEFNSLLSSIDKRPGQIKLKITILETNNQDIKTREIELNSILQEIGETANFKYFFNLITLPYSVSSNIAEGTKQSFYAVLKMLDEKGLTKVESSPILTAQHNKKITFKSADNIPYKTASSSVEDAKTSNTENIEYKDVGLQIELTPTINRGDVYIDLNLVSEEVTNASITPTTSKKELTNSFRLKRGELLVLSGINKDTVIQNNVEVPLLSKVPIAGDLFKWRNSTNKKSVTTLTIEVL